MRAVRRVVVLAAVAVLIRPVAAYARGGGSGGGSRGFSGGSGGGGTFHGSTTGGYGGVSVGDAGWLLGALALAALVLLAAWLVSRFIAWIRRTGKGSGLNTVSDRAAHRADAQAHARATQIEARVAGLADTDATFDLEALKQRAVWLYETAQRAWTDRDHATLKRIMSPVLYGKWAEELGDYASRGEVNVVEIVSGPVLELVDVANRVGEINDTVTFRIGAVLNDYVRGASGSYAGRKDGATSPVEYWTLRKDAAGEWIVSSVEQAAEGAHHLTAAIETDGWDQKSVARDAVLEVAQRSSAPGASDILALTTISWSADADAAAGDLSVLDARFDKPVLEVAIEQFLEQWAMQDGSLDFTSVRTVNRTVMREAGIDSVEVRALVSRDPIVFRVAVHAHGVYYEVDRRTEEVLRGDAHHRRPVAFTFDLRLEDAPAKGWTVVAGGAQPAA
jgi:predicted lipid-binding transport protein (Tim44 family)